ncbi:MAG: hypothetical protein E7K72_13450 [Roseomonas mucosa]|nr:hypothetical protein [Roseomonas mucosa]
MPVITEKELHAAMRDPRYTQSGHPESRAFRTWVGEGWRQLVAANEAGQGDGQRSQVRVRPYQRQRNGHAEQVSGYTQSRASGRGEAAHAPSPANDPQPAAPAAPANGNQPEKRVVIFVGGAGDKSLSGTVERYQATFTGRHHVGSKYFAHDQADEIRRYIEGQPSGTKVSLIGHSYGGDTAIEVAGKLAQEGHKIDTLVTVDPVGSRRNSADFLIWAKQGADRWINVNATGGSALEFSNAVAGLGGAYNERPQQYADVHFNVAATHGSFPALLEGRNSDGYRALDAALGTWSAPRATGSAP